MPPPKLFASHAILNTDFFDAVRTMRELHTLHAKGAVLNKRLWWIKWATQPKVRAKWLAEIEEALVKAHVSHVWSEWPNRRSIQEFEGRSKLLEIAAMTSEAEKAASMEAVLAEVLYPAGYDTYGPFSEGTHYESDGDEEAEVAWTELEELEKEAAEANGANEDHEEDDHDDEEDEDDDGQESYQASAANTNFAKVFARHKKMYAVAQIAWYVAMTMVREELRLLEPAEWTRQRVEACTDQIWSSENQDLIVRTCTLIAAVVREGPCPLEVLLTYLPDERRKKVLKLLQYHFTKIRVMLEASKSLIENELEVIITGLGLTGAQERGDEPVHVPGPAPKTWLSDNCIPASVKSKFVAEIATLENVPDDAKDWHPNTENQVLNLVHPSLYCGVSGERKLLAASEAQNLYSDAAAHLRAIMFAPTPRVLESQHSGFQWLPCEIDVADSGDTARVRTYINNLHPEDHAPLYDSISDIFACFVPLFDQVLSTLVDPHARAVYAKQPTYSIAGSRCQVIVKIAEIVLTPEKPLYAGGSWHIEGTKAENIVATGLYYFGCENITESRLSFCSFVDQPDYEQSDDTGVALSYGLHNERALIQGMGSVTAMEDRCVVFPNILHHKVEPFELADPTKPGVRKILAFFLVNPTMDPIVSTAVVPPQQEEWADRVQEPALKRLRVPDTVVGQIQDMARDRMSLEQAQEIRLELMDERSASSLDDLDDPDYVFSLCEH